MRRQYYDRLELLLYLQGLADNGYPPYVSSNGEAGYTDSFVTELNILALTITPLCLN
jgi:hypothetical protein